MKRIAALCVALLLAGLTRPATSRAADMESGTRWTPMVVPATDDLYGIWGSSPTDVFAVGESGTIVHFDGQGWSRMASGTTSPLRRVWGTAADNVYAVGGDSTVLRYDGATWSPVPATPTYEQVDLRYVWGRSASDIYIGGDGMRDALYYNYRFDGSAWKWFLPPIMDSIIDVWGTPSTDVHWLAVGNDGRGYRSWVIRSAYPHTDQFAKDMNVGAWVVRLWGSSPTDIYGVGPSGTIAHYTGGDPRFYWLSMESGTSAHLRGVWGSAADDVYAVGDGGTILHCDGERWTSMPTGTGSRLWSVWGSSEDDVFAVGDSGSILRHRDGPPALATVGDRWVNERETLAFTLQASDPGGDSLSYSATGLPKGAALDASTGVFRWTPAHDQAGIYRVTFQVSDGGRADSETVTITVRNKVVFYDDFADGTSAGDPEWKAVLGSWGVTGAASLYASSPRKAANLALSRKVARTFAAGVVSFKAYLRRPMRGTANAALLFAYRGTSLFRYVELLPGRVVIGQLGALGGQATLRKVFPTALVQPDRWQAVKVMLALDGTVTVSVSTKVVATYRFTQRVAGNVGLRVNAARSLFDSFMAQSALALQ